MAAQSFKNYVVRYNLTVDPGAAIKSIETLRTAADKAWAPLDGVARALETISAHFTRLKQASSFEFKPAVNLSVFKKQCGEMEAVAKQTAERISAILNGSLTAAPLGKATKPSTKGGEKKRKNTITRTVDQLKKERDDIRKSLKVFGPGAASRENTKAYKNILSRYEKDIASLRAIQEKRKVLAQINKDIAAANKSKSKSITKKIGKSTVATIVKGAEESVKKGGGTSANILKSFNAALSGLVGKQSVKIPVSIVVPEGIKGQLAAAIKRMEAGITVNIPVKAVPVQSGKQSGNAANGLSKKDNRLLTTLQNRVAANEAKRETAKGAVKGGLTTSINRDKAKINALLSKGGVSSGQPRGAIAEAMTRVQGLANTKPIRLSTVFVPDGQAGFGLSMDIFKLQELANTKPIKISTVLVPNGQAGFGLRMDIFKLQELANLTPVRIPVVGTPVTATGKAAATGAVQKNVKVAGTTGLQPLPANANNTKPTKTITPGISAANINKKAEALTKLNAVLSKLPPSLDRSYTIKLSVTGVDRKIAQLERLIPLLSKLPADMSKIYNVSATGNIGNTGNNGTASQSRSSYISASGFGNRAVITPRNARRVSMNSLGYQIFGNTSFGARTPMFLDMMKGMGVMTGVGAAMSTISNAFSHAAEYQNTMLTAQAILKENYKGTNFYGDFDEMTEIVRDVAKRTKFTAPQAADAARFMAMAGLNIPMINAAISPIADVAVIGDNDLGEVADKMTNIMTAFNLKPQNMRHLADALTKTFTSTNTDMMMLAESMQYAAPMAHLAGANVEEALAMIGIMGNAGIQGSMAGTTLRMMYQNIIKPNKNQAKMWAKLGIKTTDENGHTRNIIDVLSDLRGKLSFKDAKDIEGNWKDEGTPVAKAVSELFRVTASAGAGTLLENLDKVKALAEANRTVTSLSESVSQVKQNDVKGMWAKLTSAFTDAVVSEFESSESVIKKYLGSITEYLKSEEFKKTLHDIFELVTALADIMGKVANIWKFMVNSLGGMYTWVLQAQFLFHQLSFIATPFRQLWQVGAKTRGALHGVSGMGGLGLAGFGGMAAASTVGAGGVGSRLGKYYALPATGAIALRDGLTARGIYGGISHPFTESGLVRAGGSYQSVGLRKPWASSQTIMPFMPFLPPHTSSANAMRASTAMRASSLRFTNPLVQSSAGFRASIAGIGKKRLNKLQASIIARQNEAMATSASIAMQRGRNAYALDALILASGLAGTQYRYYAGPHGRAFASQAHLIRPMAVQPFGKFNYNSPSAVLHGGMPQVRFAREYDKRAKAFERGANALRRSGASMERIELAQKRAEAYARAAQQATPKRPQRLGWQTALLRERAERIYTARGRFGANFGKLTSWGMAGMNAAAIGSFLKSKTLSLAGFGGKAAGLLLNPLTLAGAALGIPLMVSISRSLKASETRNATHASIVQNAKNTQELLRTSTSGFSLADALSGIKEINVNTASINVDKQTQTPNAVPLSAKEEYAQILNLIGGTPKKGGSVGRMGDILVTDDWKGLNEAYDAMAAPMSKYISSIETGRRGLALAQKDERTRARDIMKGLIGQQALESPEFASAKNKISDIYTEFGNLPKEEQAQKYYAMRSEVMSILNQYNPSGMNLPQITTHNYLKAKTASPTSFYEYYETIHNALEEFYENSPAIKAIEAMQGLSADAEDWWKRIGDIISGIPMSGLSDSQGKSVSVTVPIEEGRFRFDKFLRILNDNNVTLVDATSEYMEWLEKAYDSMFNNPLLKELIGNLSKDDFLSHFRNVNYGVWSYIQPWAGYRANIPAANTDKDKEGTGELLKRPSQTPIKLGYPKQDGYSSKYSFSSRANGGTANVNISSMTINTNGANNEAIAQNAGEQFYEVLLNALNNNA